MHSHRRRSFILILASLALAAQGMAQSAIPAGARFVMSHFKSDGGGGDERLFVSTSPDGLVWTALNSGNPVWQPAGWAPFTNVVRDPTIIFAGGAYWVAYTSGNYGAHASFGLVKSTDLLNWTFVGEISTAFPGQTDPLTWNPCFFRDGDGSVHVLVSVSPIQGSEYNPVPAMRSYELHPTSTDWTSWSVPVAVGLPSTNTNELWVWKEGAVYHAIYVDFSQNGVEVHVTSSQLLSGWRNPQVLGFRGQEGGFVLKFPGGGYRLYLEPGNASGGPPTTYLVTQTSAGFSGFTAQVPVQSSIGMRNGKPTAISGGTMYADWVHAHLAAEPAALQAPLADPDGDGLSNALEYAFDLDPTTPDVSLAPRLGWPAGGGGPTMTFREDPGLSDVTYLVESSPDLVQWSSGSSSVQLESATLLTDGALETVAQDLAQPGLSGAHYLRVRVAIASAPSNFAKASSILPAKRAAQSASRIRQPPPSASRHRRTLDRRPFLRNGRPFCPARALFSTRNRKRVSSNL